MSDYSATPLEQVDVLLRLASGAVNKGLMVLAKQAIREAARIAAENGITIAVARRR